MKSNKLKVVLSVFLMLFFIFSIGAQQFKVLLFTKTVGFHHESILEGVRGIRSLAAKHDFIVDWQENSNVFNDENLSKYQCVVFLSTTGDILNENEQKSFEKFIRNGNGFVGVHSASNTETDWLFFTKMLGMTFKIHPLVQTAYIKVEDSNFPGMERFPKKMLWTDEWYEFNMPAISPNLNYLLSVDEKTYKPYIKFNNQEGNGMGEFHPTAWYQFYEGGRSFYTSLGHIDAIYSDEMFLEHLFGGIYWAATGKGL
ncbi:ThuA domain-containing protein [Mariniflexile jejuense]|uniref:ThuA domain-containing protein n=1 Tax=Mariniflexile jejuense TaxID=1173582 RepID=A0ABW3JP68_9FLAO